MNNKLHRTSGHPAPVSSPQMKRALWDDEQSAVFWAGEPMPAWSAASVEERYAAGDPDDDPDEDLLDRYEAAQFVGIEPQTWRRYQTHPNIDPPPPAPVPAPGPLGEEIDEDHWRRGDLTDWLASRDGAGVGGGRPEKAVSDETAHLVHENPRITHQEAAAALRVGHGTALHALAQARADAVAELLEETRQDLTPEEAAEQLGYQLFDARRALAVCAARARAEGAEPYLASVAEELTAAGCPTVYLNVRVRPGAVVAAELRLREEQPGGVHHLVWDERYGWRTSPHGGLLNRAEATPPTGTGIRYLSNTRLATPAAELLPMLENPRAGSPTKASAGSRKPT